MLDGCTCLDIRFAFYTSSMALSIKNPEADLLARELAAVTGESLTDAVLLALRERLERQRRHRRPGIGRRLRHLSEETRELPVLDGRSAEEVLGYDDHGLPS
jgi:antitoxin VapB